MHPTTEGVKLRDRTAWPDDRHYELLQTMLMIDGIESLASSRADAP